jgi:putative FmdB family regulatory protein
LPLYEYECPKDGTFELVRKFSDPPLTACPTCGGPIEKLVSAPAIQFKGSGWYITDYARKSTGGEAAGRKDGDSKDAGKKDGGGTDKGSSETSKPAASSASATESKSTSTSSSSGSDKK